MKCPACENDVPSGRSACTWCGAPLPSAGGRPGSGSLFTSEPLTGPQAGPPNPKTEPMPIPVWNSGDEWPELPPIRPAAARTDPQPPGQENAAQSLGAPMPPAFDPAGRYRETPPANPAPPGQENATQQLGAPIPPAFDPAGWHREAPPASPPPLGQENATQHLGAPMPPAFDPAGWDQGVPPGSGDLAAPPPDGGSGKSRKNLLLVCGIAAVVLIGGGVVYALTQGGSESGTRTAGGKASAGGAAQQAAAVNQILKSGKAARGHLPSPLRTCNDVAAGVPGFQQVVRDRQQELAQSKKLKVDQLPGGSGLRKSMINAYQSSLNADQAYLAWAQEVQGRGCGNKIAPLTAHYRDAIAANDKAGPAKRRVVSLWKPIASSNGLPTYLWNRL